MNPIDLAIVIIVSIFAISVLYLIFGKGLCPRCKHPKILHSRFSESDGTPSRFSESNGTPTRYVCQICGKVCIW